METSSLKTLSGLNVHEVLFTFATCVFTAWLFQFFWKNSKLHFHTRNMPGPFALPILGSIRFLRWKDAMSDLMKILYEFEQKYSTCYKLWLGSDLIFVVSSPEYCEKILNNHKSLNKHHLYRFVTEVVGDGILTSSDFKWRKHRKLISPSFNQKMLNSFVSIFDEQSDTLIDALSENVGVQRVQIYHMLCRCTLDIICQTTMGVNVNVQKSEDNFGEVVEGLLELTAYRMFHPWAHNDFIWNLTARGKKQSYYCKKFNEKIKFVIKTKLEAWNELKRQSDVCLDAEVEERSTKKRLAILDLLAEDSVLTEEELRDEVSTFIIAGTETTASSLCFIFVVLGLFPDVQSKVYEEVTDIFGVDGPITTEGITKMKYTERVIKETMRLFPLGPVIARGVTEHLVIGDQVHPAGSGITMNVFMMHRNPKYWPDPLKFDPDRFLPEEVSKRNPYTYMAFSLGPRMCIGWRYAMLNMKMILAKVVRNFKIHTEYKSIEEIKLVMHIVLRMKGGPKVWMERR